MQYRNCAPSISSSRCFNGALGLFGESGSACPEHLDLRILKRTERQFQLSFSTRNSRGVTECIVAAFHAVRLQSVAKVESVLLGVTQRIALCLSIFVRELFNQSAPLGMA